MLPMPMELSLFLGFLSFFSPISGGFPPIATACVDFASAGSIADSGGLRFRDSEAFALSFLRLDALSDDVLRCWPGG